MKRPAFLLALAIAATSAIAQTMPATTQATTRPRGDLLTLTVSPMAVPVPALKYPLRVAFADQIDGNAAPLYLQAFAEIEADPKLDAILKAVDDCEDDASFAKRIADVAPAFDAALPPLLATATLRGACDWSIPIRFENVRATVPFLNHARTTMRLLYAKFRVALISGDVDQAVRLMRVTSVLADKVDAGDVYLLNDLVSVGMQAYCVAQMNARLIERSDAPNLYWSMRTYRVPFGNLRGSIDCEQAMLFAAFPVLRKSRDGVEITAADWQAFMTQASSYTQQFGDAPRGRLTNDLVAGAAAIAFYGPAKTYYAETRHLADAQVAKLEPLKVVATYAIESYQRSADQFYKWFVLPYPQMLPGLAREKAEMREQTMRRGASAAMDFFLTIAPSLDRFAITNARVDRTIAAITVVEALRAYAAAHDGTLPATLNAIVETPAPDNPVTGKPFDYAVNGDVATISDLGTLVDWPLRYDVRLRR